MSNIVNFVNFEAARLAKAAAKAPVLDAIDVAILAIVDALAETGVLEASAKHLAALLGISHDECNSRTSRLADTGYLTLKRRAVAQA
ncbi:hypothetical protein [Methylocella sp.]|jgi:DNA-binding Lrp family transcriptional regulator|uniref:hypothetical protein n=1 Tax=Methylocella sp. TaxID=1978226 RepID=UPI003C131850